MESLFFYSTHVLIDGVFIRSSDDVFAVYATRGEFSGDCYNISLINSVLAPDIAHPINIGTHGDTSRDGNTISNVHFEDFILGELLNLSVVYNTKYNSAAGRELNGIYFKDVSYITSYQDCRHIQIWKIWFILIRLKIT
ncbi:MAG: hypothetical protein PHH37_14235 [Paludibacter sp.]|nr:hypothetical protein [Paludibacter sp.]